MAIVQGIRERVHLPIYDSLTVEPGKQLRESEPSSTLKFFINVQNKTKLETNLQSASLLPHYNTFEARAMRVVISDLPPKFGDDEASGEGFPVENEDGNFLFLGPGTRGTPGTPGSIVPELGPPEPDLSPDHTAIVANLTLGIDRVVELIREAKEAEDGFAEIDFRDDGIDSEGVEFFAGADGTTPVPKADVEGVSGAALFLSVDDLKSLFEGLKDKRKVPLDSQIDDKNSTAYLINQFIYNTVTTLYVGEKIMIQMPTWFFPSGAGAYSEQGRSATHGLPSPSDTFRFAEPIHVDKQQNFRVDIEIPDADMQKAIQRMYGPMFIWVVLDGFMTRGVQ